MTHFNGFTQQALTFLQDVCKHNSKDWFNEHRSIYDNFIVTPLRDLVDSLSESMLLIDSQFETRPAIGKTISRIHRDTRFSYDKSPYRSRMWITFKRPGKEWQDAPAFFFEISPDSYRYGLGYYCATRLTMDAFRAKLLKQTASFLSLTRPLLKHFELAGESYKRPLIKQQEPELANWYNRKSFALIYTDYEVERLFTPAIATELQQRFMMLAKFYHYLQEIEVSKVNSLLN